MVLHIQMMWSENSYARTDDDPFGRTALSKTRARLNLFLFFLFDQHMIDSAIAAVEDDASISVQETLPNGDSIVLTMDKLDETGALNHVRRAEAGATVLFVGTTRNEFQGASMLHL